LLKPVRRERLETARAFASRLGRRQLALVNREAQPAAPRTNICVRRGADLHLIPVEEIVFFHADQKYISVRHGGGEDLIDEPLKDLAEEFADHFIRVHRSTLIALRFLQRMERNDEGQYEVWLKGVDEPMPVSRRHVTAVKSCLKHPA
ncbi:MAG: LytR/AlgR family response regulator transcription factor, partial [Gammaproteobacteria bacterium]